MATHQHSDNEAPQTQPASIATTLWTSVAIVGGISAAYLVAHNEPVARYVHVVFLCSHLLAICGIVFMGIVWSTLSEAWRHSAGNKLLLIFVGFFAFMALISYRVISGDDWNVGMVAVATGLSGFGFTAGIVAVYFLPPILSFKRPLAIRLAWPDSMVNEYNSLVADKKYQEALQLLEPALSRKRPNGLFHILEGVLRLKMGELDKGSQLVTQGMSTIPRDAVTLAAVASTFHTHNLLELGKPLIDEALAKDREHPAVLLVWSKYLFSEGKPTEAREIWSRIKPGGDQALSIAIELLKDSNLHRSLTTLEDVEEPRP